MRANIFAGIMLLLLLLVPQGLTASEEITTSSSLACTYPAVGFIETGPVLELGGGDPSKVVHWSLRQMQAITFAFVHGTQQTVVIDIINSLSHVTGISASQSSVNPDRVQLTGVGDRKLPIEIFQSNHAEPLLFETVEGGEATGYLFASPQPGAPADFTCDGSVSIDDLLMLLRAWGECTVTRMCLADLDDDGDVDFDDMTALLANWS